MKIALIGTEDASHGLAPWEDSSWKIWACSPNSRSYPRVDRHFEVHNPDVMKTYLNAALLDVYFAHLKKHKNVWALRLHPELPGTNLLNDTAIIERFGKDFLTSTVAWMMAEAIMTPKTSEIGLFGIDCSASEEHAQQRPGIKFFVREARLAKIKVSAPYESDILRSAPVYGLREFNPMFRKNWAKHLQYEAMLSAAEAAQVEAMKRTIGLQGAVEQIDYYLRTWDDE